MKGPKSYPLIIGLLVPVFMVVFIAVGVFVPRFFAPSAQYDFLYSAVEGYCPDIEYLVRDGRVQHQEPRVPAQGQVRCAAARLYRHDIRQNISRSISFEEAQKLALSDATQSPDGFEVGPGRRGDMFLLFYSSYADWSSMYLLGHGVEYKLNLAKEGRAYYSGSNFRFIGWVLP